MAKFNKDEFLNLISTKVKDAIKNELITQEDIQSNDIERLEGFIQYSLADYIEDRKMAIDILKDFNYDERYQWDKLQNEYGKFNTLSDIALVNLWKFLESQGIMSYSYYDGDSEIAPGKPIKYEEDEFEDEGNDDFTEDDFYDEYEEDDFEDDMPVRKRYVVK